MIEFEHLVDVILGQCSTVSRREHVKLVCDNAALTSALEQKERARALAMAENRGLRRALDDARRVIDRQAAEIAQLEDLALCQAKTAAQLTAPSLSAGEVRWMVRNEQRS